MLRKSPRRKRNPRLRQKYKLTGSQCKKLAPFFKTAMEQTINYKGYTIEIKQDSDPQNPRTDWDPAAHMVCWHSRHNLGDMESNGKKGREQRYSPVSENYPDGPRQLLYELAGIASDALEEGEDICFADLYRLIEESGTIIRTLGLLDHSGLHIYIGGRAHWSDPGGWDSGPVGYIYMTKEDIINTYGNDSPESYENANKLMEGEVETYDDYLRGNVYGYNVEDAPGMGDSC